MRYGVSGCGGGDYFTSHLKVNKNKSSGSEWGQFGMMMLGNVFDMAALLGTAAATGAMGPSKKGIAKAADANKAQTANQLSQATTQFKAKYPKAQFSAEGKVTSDFESLQKPYNNRLETLNKQLVDAQGKEKSEVTQIKAAKAEYQSLSDDSKVCNQNHEAMQKIVTDAGTETHEGVSVASVIDFGSTPAKINENALKNAFAGEAESAGKEGKLTDKAKAQINANNIKRDGLKAKAQAKVDAYNNLSNQNQSILQMHGMTDIKEFGNDSSGKIGAAKTKLDGLTKSTTGEQIKSTLNQIDATQAQLDKLGNKADFDKAKNEINGLVDQLAQDKSVGDARQNAKEAKQQYKDAKKAGLKGHDLDLLKQRKNDYNKIANSAYQQYFQSRMSDS